MSCIVISVRLFRVTTGSTATAAIPIFRESRPQIFVQTARVDITFLVSMLKACTSHLTKHVDSATIYLTL